MNIIERISGFLRHCLSAGNEHSVHSPFVYSLLTEAIYTKTKEPEFIIIENIRNQLLKDNRIIDVTDLGAGSSFDGRLQKRSIREIARKFAKSPKHGRFLFRLARHLRPEMMIELGTSLGISAMYLSAGNPGGKLYTLEGCGETAKVAQENFSANRFENITCITGHFDDTLPGLLNRLNRIDFLYIDGNHTFEATLRYFTLALHHVHENSVIVFDDIYWSHGMQKAWEYIRNDPEVTISIDFYQFGVIFFHKDFSKQHFKLRL